MSSSLILNADHFATTDLDPAYVKQLAVSSRAAFNVVEFRGSRLPTTYLPRDLLHEAALAQSWGLWSDYGFAAVLLHDDPIVGTDFTRIRFTGDTQISYSYVLRTSQYDVPSSRGQDRLPGH